MILDRFLLPGLGVLLALATAAAGVQTWRLDSAQDTLAEERLQRSQEREAAAQAARDAEAEYRLLEAAMRAAVKEAEDAARLERARLERRAAADRADADRVRDELAAFAAGGGEAAGDSVDACRARAAQLGGAVDDGLRVQAAMAARFGDLAADYRLLHMTCSAVMPSATAQPRSAPP